MGFRGNVRRNQGALNNNGGERGQKIGSFFFFLTLIVFSIPVTPFQFSTHPPDFFYIFLSGWKLRPSQWSSCGLGMCWTHFHTPKCGPGFWCRVNSSSISVSLSGSSALSQRDGADTSEGGWTDCMCTEEESDDADHSPTVGRINKTKSNIPHRVILGGPRFWDVSVNWVCWDWEGREVNLWSFEATLIFTHSAGVFGAGSGRIVSLFQAPLKISTMMRHPEYSWVEQPPD